MSSFFVNRSLSRGDLTLFLRNGQDRPQDGYDVRWTVYRKDGIAASGLRIPATRAGTGEYYAPWGCARSGGCYYVKWEYSDSPGGVRQCWSQDFIVLDGSGCCAPCASPVSAADAAACGSYYAGQVLGPGDLCFQVTDDDGLPAQAYLVFWTVFDSCGRQVSPRTEAVAGTSLGRYCACWTVGCSGSYTVKWEWMLDPDSPLSADCSRISVVPAPAVMTLCGPPSSSTSALFCGDSCEVAKFNPCPQSPPPQIIVVNGGSCESASIPRSVVLPSQVLPVGGGFTSQSSFPIPKGVRRVSYYVKYTHGVTGGYPVVRLMWGNGVEETQSTIIDASFSAFDGVLAANQMRLNDLVGPIPSDDNPIYFMIESTVPGGATTTRLLIAEAGQIGVPGLAEISLTGS